LAFERVRAYVDDLVTSVLEDPTIPEDDRQARLLERLKDVRDKVLNLRLIFIEVGDQDEATTIFVTLNSRGLDLEPADLVKAHLLNLLPKKGVSTSRSSAGSQSSTSSTLRPRSCR
jgi:hypothetical protein